MTAIAPNRSPHDSWPPGAYWWLGDECLRSLGLDEHGSHRCEVVVRAESFTHPLTGERRWAWPCPGCGCAMAHIGEDLPTRHDPRCPECQCPPTQRDPSLSPAAPGIRDVATGGPDSK